MRIDLHKTAKRTQKNALFAKRIALVEGFIAQTDDGRVRALLRFAIKHLQTCYNNPKTRKTRNLDYQLSWVREKNDETRKVAVRTYRRWTPEEDEAVRSASVPDAEIGKALGRSLKAVECRRVLLKARMRPIE